MAWERVTPETIRNCFLQVSEEEVAAQEAAVLKDDLDLNKQINNHLVTVGTGEDSLDTVNLSSNDENDDIHKILTMDQRLNQLMNSQQIDDEEQVDEEIEEEVVEEEEESLRLKLAEKRQYYQQFVDRLSLDDQDDLDIFYLMRKKIKLLETKERAEVTYKQARITDFTN
ncbi:hypothetical protein INT45_006285 [Circinella minor]|uniref:Uncharacterized protein n=1 Tax=Circinella minor TaxID=1195481 RepID=A0A8H7RYX2_9FUNG|nr:hypothetical protein INT45_006285 [Circinella minor]